MHPNIHSSIIYNCKDMKTTSVQKQMNELRCGTYTHKTEYYSTIKKEWNFLPFAVTQMIVK